MADTRFAGRKVLVTGAAQGIGRAIATAFYEEGADVVIADLNAAKANETAAELAENRGGSTSAVHCDVTDESSVHAAFRRALDSLGRLDVLCNNAGTVTMAKTADMTAAEWDLTMGVIATGTFLCTREAIPLMLDAGSGVVVNIASQAGKRGYPLFSHYCAAKAAVINFSRSVALEYAPDIRVNCVCPGIVDTDMMDREYVWENAMTGESIESIKARWMSGIPMGRFQKAEQVAGVVLFLASDAASEITGQAMNITGGMVMD